MTEQRFRPAMRPDTLKRIDDELAELERAEARRVAARAMLAALEGLLAASAHMSPFGGEASVKGVRLAGKYMEAHDKATAAIAAAKAAGIKAEG